MTILAEYTPDALATAEPRAFDLEYLLPGLVGEAGELVGEFAKRHWHGTPRTDEIISEYGDLAWLTAVLLHREGVESTAHVTTLRYMRDPDSALELIISRAFGVYRSGDDTRAARAAGLWVALQDHARVVTSVTFEDVLRANLDKLEARSGAGQLRTHA